MKPREVKRREAEQRQAKRNGRSAKQQLEILKHRPGKSLKETARLKKLLEVQKEQKTKQKK